MHDSLRSVRADAWALLRVPLGDIMQAWLVPDVLAFELLVEGGDTSATVVVDAEGRVPPTVALPHGRPWPIAAAMAGDRAPLPQGMPRACTVSIGNVEPASKVRVRVRARSMRGWGPFSPDAEAETCRGE
jgi:hypothetical protein